MRCLFCEKEIHGHLCCADCEPLFGKGQRNGDRWIATVRHYHQLFHKPPFNEGTGISSEILQRLMTLKIKEIEINYEVRGRKARFVIPIEDFLKQGIIYNNKGRGRLIESESDRQYVIPMPEKIREQLHLS